MSQNDFPNWCAAQQFASILGFFNVNALLRCSDQLALIWFKSDSEYLL